MDVPPDTAGGQADRGQKALWSGVAGRGWVAAQELLDRMYQPFEDLLAESVALGAQVLDVGCGVGATTLAAARRAGECGRCVGVDISEPMIEAARLRTEREAVPALFLHGDAASHTFQPAAFDVIISRFGVMFFDDAVGAFANLRGAARAGGRLRFVAWRGPAENPFLTAAEQAASPMLPGLASRDPDAPGPFALARQDHTRRVLADSGWTGIDIERLDVPCSLSEAELERYFTLVGPVGRALAELDGDLRAKVIEAVRTGFAPFLQDGRVRYTAACWAVNAVAPPAR
ncbi:class I SAM-dependent methyltransferase [Frankia sp. AgB1.9]|uniref:class I SAM-dependent methyltransferase n=1 Tax=unclassified Frankia TaxID=2632575 RepID=UPI001933A1D5|nr:MULTISPECIES: class I SAM-dependent methyltransferase [unclassified Frankia]MBL7490441.1 class I SAM-dependent methyltransferase [Frankia sp. AgW1.1]MBL7553394.1 class I SAM-dependent methyltransferase [Frankia sp. AgB1.9]MBL7618329.1 class I SAM-dependent methyltransferase [Frankia sp. AgB1.8]